MKLSFFLHTLTNCNIKNINVVGNFITIILIDVYIFNRNFIFDKIVINIFSEICIKINILKIFPYTYLKLS